MTLHPALRVLLWPASVLFGMLVRLRAWLYGMGILQQRRLNGVVISVGNLTVGGTGKTSLVLWLAERLRSDRRRVGILTRGYRGAGTTSDEVELLRQRLGHEVKIGVGADRYAQGRTLEQQGVEWFILDDGFQHLRLARDAEIVLLDGTNPFGGGQLLPAGRLREPRSALKRGHIVVITRTDNAPAVESVVRRYTHAPVFYAQTQLDGVFDLYGDPHRPTSHPYREMKLLAFCGIGNPLAFFDDLSGWGMHVAARQIFPDHYAYNAAVGPALEFAARQARAEGLICTEKDLWNLKRSRTLIKNFPVFYCRISLCVADAEGLLEAVYARTQEKQMRQ